MLKNRTDRISDFKRVFLQPSNPTQRRYEALRAYFVDEVPSNEVALRFGYTPATFRVMCSKFRKDPHQDFFLPVQRGPKSAPKKDDTREQIICLRKQNLSIYDISKALKGEGKTISPSMVSIILKEEGFAKLPRRRDDDRPVKVKPTVAAVADVGEFSAQPRTVHTKFGGLFLFLPFLADVPFDRIMKRADLPGSEMIPEGHAMRALLGLKLFGNARHSHVMSYALDEGLGLFAGLNVIPKREFLTSYSSRINPSSYPKLMRLWFDAAGELGLPRGVAFHLDFHTIPFHGEDALVQKHFVSKRSRRQKGILAFLAQDAETRVFCYANAQVRKDDRNDEVLRFVEFWKKRTGHFPEELVFDSGLTTHENLCRLNRKKIRFITLRRRSAKMVEALSQTPMSEWTRIELSGVSREYRNPRILDHRIDLHDYEGHIRQIAVADLGHEKPTLVLTNYLRMSPRKIVERYAQRMIIENSIEDSIDFFHMDALSSAVAMKVDLDLQLTLMASSLYRLFGSTIGSGYENAKSRTIFRDFIDATAVITLTKEEIQVRFQRRTHNPYLLQAGFHDLNLPIPWIANKRLRFIFR